MANKLGLTGVNDLSKSLLWDPWQTFVVLCIWLHFCHPFLSPPATQPSPYPRPRSTNPQELLLHPSENDSLSVSFFSFITGHSVNTLKRPQPIKRTCRLILNFRAFRRKQRPFVSPPLTYWTGNADQQWLWLCANNIRSHAFSKDSVTRLQKFSSIRVKRWIRTFKNFMR